MSGYIIQEWDASYYCWDEMIWKYGKLVVCSNCICFFENNSKMDDKSLPKISLDLQKITEFQRRYVSFLFKAIVIRVERARPQWFSSLKNREETYFFLEHFWQQQLLLGLGSPRRTNYQSRKEGMSNENHEYQRQNIFKVLYDSENTLIGAADCLHNQGEQFDHSSITMNTIHTDLSVAETLINGLDKWTTKWDITPENFYEIEMKKDFPVLYRKSANESFCSGQLLITQDQLTVLNMKRVAVMNLLQKDLTNIIVTTPWNITLIKSVLGQPTVTVEITSAHVVYIIKALQYKHGDKFEYEESPSHAKRILDFGKETNGCHILPASSLDDQVQDVGSQPRQMDNLETQQHCYEILSERDKADLDKVSDVVQNMKSLAIGIGTEMERQLDSVDQLSESVDKANYRLKQDNQKLEDKS